MKKQNYHFRNSMWEATRRITNTDVLRADPRIKPGIIVPSISTKHLRETTREVFIKGGIYMQTSNLRTTKKAEISLMKQYAGGDKENEATKRGYARTPG